MTDSSLAMPLYHQVAGVLRQRIRDSIYAVGGQLLPEDELATEFGVSRATVRQAVGMLVFEGLLVRRQGRGTFVKKHDSGVLSQRFRGSLGDLIQQSRPERTRDIEISHDEPLPAYVATALQLETARGTVVRQTRMMNSEPISHAISCLPDPIGKALTVAKLKKSALIEVLLEAGVDVQGATQTIRAELADVPMCAKLNVELGAAILYIERLVTDSAGRPVDFVRTWCRGDRYDYEITLEFGPRSGQGRSVNLA